MKARRRLRTALLVLCTGFASVALVLRNGGTVFSESRRPDLPPSTSSLCFRLEKDEWLRFNVPPAQRVLKVLANATGRLDPVSAESEQLLYSFDYRLLDAAGQLVHEGTYYLRSGAESFRDIESGAVYPSHFFGGVGESALSTRTAVLNLRQYAVAVTRVDLRRGESSAAIEDIFVRVYFNEQPAGYKFRYLWRRLPLATRERLTRGNVHGMELLTERETENLLRNRWSGVVPQGVTGEDYHADRLYAVRLPRRQKLRDAVLPRGLVGRRGEIAVLPLGDDGGCARLEIHATEGEFRGGEVHLTLYGGGGDEPIYRVIELGAPISEIVEELPGGTLEIVPSIDVVVRAFLAGAPAEIEITPITISRPAYIVAPGRGVSFALERYDVSPLPFRVEARGLLDGGAVRFATELRYALIDGGGRLLQRGSVALDAPRSWHDRLRRPFEHRALSEAVRLHFWIPPGVAWLRLESDAPGLLVAGATGLPGVPRRVRVGRVPEASTGRSWFPLRPAEYEGFVERGDEVFIRVQERPPPAAGDGSADYVTLAPQENELAVQLLAPRSGAPEPCETARLASWSPLAIGAVSDVYFVARPGAAGGHPRLLVAGQGDTSALLEYEIDGRNVLRQEIRGATNLVDLPAVSPGWREVVLRSDAPLRAFLAGALTGETHAHAVVSAYWLNEAGLTFVVRKRSAEREVAHVQIFAPATHTSPLRLHALIKNFSRQSGVYASWTHERKELEVWPDAARTYPLLWTSGRYVVGGERVAMALGSDMPPGLYEIVLRSETRDDACLVRLSHRRTAALGAARFFTEEALPCFDDVDDD